MSTAPYLVQIRTMGGLKQYLRAISYDIADEFGVTAAVNPRPVPHVTLFGPYDTPEGYEAKRIIREVCSEFDTVPFQLNGFGHFGTDVIYVNVVPSPELRQLRHRLSSRLRPICSTYQPYDFSRYYQFHITVAMHDIESQFEEIWSYVNNEFDPGGNQYALRITSLDNREIMHEYDLLQDQLLSRNEALSEETWEGTKELLADCRSPNDHERCRKLTAVEEVYRKLGVKLFERRRTLLVL